VHESKAIADRRVLGEGATARDGLLVGVEGEDDAVGSASLQNRPRVAATAEGAVEVAPAGARVEGGDGFREEDGEVTGAALTPCPSPFRGRGGTRRVVVTPPPA
jgi:hypothetical protein